MLARVLLGCAIAWLVAGAAQAGALRVSPVGLDLPDTQSAATLTLSNDDATEMNVQVRIYRWTQVNGEDILEPAQDVVASPPIASVAPKSERLVRIVRTGAPVPGEVSYRLIVDELPPPPGSGAREVRLLMRHSIPVFFTTGEAGEAKLAWRVSKDGTDQVLVAHNTGARRLRVSNMKLLAPHEKVLTARGGLLGYILPGSEVRWRLPVEPAVAALAPNRLTADTDTGSIDVSLTPGS